MLIASVLDLQYCRLLTDQLTAEEARPLSSEFDYVFAVCYDECQAPNFQVVKKNACIINTVQSIENTFAQFNATTRKHIRRSEKIADLQFYHDYGDDFSEYYSFYQACEQERNWFPVPQEELRNSLLFSAKFEGNWICGISCYAHEDRLRLGRIYSRKRQQSTEQSNDLVYGIASKRIVFEFCQYASNNGYKTLDLGGVDLEDPTKAGITNFKLSFGGEVVPVCIARYSSDKFQSKLIEIKSSGYDLT